MSRANPVDKKSIIQSRFHHVQIDRGGELHNLARDKFESYNRLPFAWDVRVKKPALLIFFLALLVRIVIILSCFQGYTNSDGIYYHNIAVNIVKGKGYSLDVTEPYRPNFFREPVYPLFLAAAYSIWSIWGDVSYLENNFFSSGKYPEIILAKVLQALVGALTCLIFYLTLVLVLKKKAAFIIGSFFSVYLPLAVYSTQIMRETIQTFLIILLNYCFARFLFSKKAKWLIAFSIFVGLANLTLQVTKFMPLLMLCFLAIYTKKLKQTLMYTGLSMLITAVTISPWVYRTLRHYPDIRLIKSIGLSYTHEQYIFEDALKMLREYGLISETELRNRLHSESYFLDEDQRIANSFNGYFIRQAELIKRALNEPLISQRKIKRAFHRFRRSWIEALWFEEKGGRLHERPHQVYKERGDYLLLCLSLTGFLFGYAAIPGLFLFYKRLFPITLCFTYFISLFYVIGFVPRTMLPVHAFIFMFSCLSFYYFYFRIVKKIQPSQIFGLLILKRE